jgi:hypothetical protein
MGIALRRWTVHDVCDVTHWSVVRGHQGCFNLVDDQHQYLDGLEIKTGFYWKKKINIGYDLPLSG